MKHFFVIISNQWLKIKHKSAFDLRLTELSHTQHPAQTQNFLFSCLLPVISNSEVRSRNVGGLQSISISIAPHEAPARATPHTASIDSHSRALLILSPAFSRS